MSLPKAQGLHCDTFSAPPLDGSLALPSLYDWHLEHSPNHPLFIFEDTPGQLKTISWAEAAVGIRRASRLVQDRIGHHPSNRVIAILASSETISYFCVMVGIMRAGWIAFPISPRNSPAAVADLLSQTNAKILLISPERANKDLVELSLKRLRDATVATYLIPTFDDIFSDLAPDSDFVPPHAVDLDDPAIILHSSGSTAFPSPVTWTHRTLVQYAALPWYGDLDLAGKIFGCHAIPMFHGMGAINMLFAPSCGLVMSVFRPQSPPIVPEPVNMMDALVAAKTDFALVVPTFLETWSRDANCIEKLAKMQGIIYGGGPLNRELGNLLASRGVSILTTYAMTQCAILSTFLPSSMYDNWEYFTFSPHCEPRFIKSEHDAFELVILATDKHSPSVVNTKIKGRDAYATNDLFLPHPSIPGLWKVFGRADDQIMHSTGEKTNPVPLENLLARDPHIRAAVIFGRGRFHCGVVIEPVGEFFFELSDAESLARFRQLIWPTIELVNEFAPTHSRIFKEMIMVASPAKPFEYTAKGTVRRQAVIAAYKDEIDVLYEEVNKDVNIDHDAPENWQFPSILAFVRETVTRTLKRQELANDADMFEYGCDSLQATWIRNSIHRSILDARVDLDIDLPANIAYRYPTILKLALFVSESIRGNPVSFDDAKHAEELDRLINKYTVNFPAQQNVTSHATRAGDCVLLVGSTGGFGANLLAKLISSPEIGRVYALSRRSSGLSLYDRHTRSFKRDGLDDSLLHSNKLIMLEGDYCAEDLGLANDVFNELRASVSHIIHNAWRIDLNLGVSSFESNIASVRNLIDIALGSNFPGYPRLIFISSVGVFYNQRLGHCAREEALNDPYVAMGSGYSEAKWISERILDEGAQQTTLKPIIVRLGQLTGGPRGAWNEHEWFPALVKSSIAMGCLPDAAGSVAWLHSDFAAEALINMRNSNERYLHLVHPQPVPWATIVSDFADMLCLPIVPYSEWLTALEGSRVSEPSELECAGENCVMQRLPALKILDFFYKAGADDINEEPLGLARLSMDKAIREVSILNDCSLARICKGDVKKWLMYWKTAGFIL